MSAHSFRAFGLLAFVAVRSQAIEEPLDVDRYVAMVLRSHPGVTQATALQGAADAERKAVRLFPDPVFELARGRAQPSDALATRGTETSYSVSQTLPWPGTFKAGLRVGDRAADALRANAEALRWELVARARESFARLTVGRALRDLARAAESDARSLRDLVTRRAELGEARESDRIKAQVEWLRQQRLSAAAEREAAAAEAVLRGWVLEPLPDPLVVAATPRRPMPSLDRDRLRALLADNPRQRGARAEAERQAALLSVAKSSRIPNWDVSLFRDTELDKRTDGFSLGLKVPLWNANRGEIARASAAAQVARAEADRIGLELRAELEGRLAELEVAAAQTLLLEREVLPAAARTVELVRLTYQEGETSLLDLLDAQRTYRETQSEAVNAQLALSAAFGSVQRLIGPDFDPWR